MADKIFTNWKNELPECRRCELHKTRQNVVSGEGNRTARIFFVAQAPGRDEDAKGKMFTGPSGEVLDELLSRIPLDRKDVYMSNLLKCFLPKCRKPRNREMETCFYYLSAELQEVKPHIIIPLGFHVTRFLFSKFGLEVPNSIEIRKVFGHLFLARNYAILPLRHPSAVVHNRKRMDELSKNYRKISQLLSECPFMKECPIPKYQKKGKIIPGHIALYCRGLYKSCVRYEGYLSRKHLPDNLMPGGNYDQII